MKKKKEIKKIRKNMYKLLELFERIKALEEKGLLEEELFEKLNEKMVYILYELYKMGFRFSKEESKEESFEEFTKKTYETLNKWYEARKILLELNNRVIYSNIV